MTAISLVRRYPSNLTPVIGTLIAWSTEHDLQAVRLPSREEAMLVNGHLIPSNNLSINATQDVINFCMLSAREQKNAFAALALLAVIQKVEVDDGYAELAQGVE